MTKFGRKHEMKIFFYSPLTYLLPMYDEKGLKILTKSLFENKSSLNIYDV